jgi:hypothetical protein
MMKNRTGLSLLLTVSLGGVACGTQNADVKPERCAPVDEVEMTGVKAEDLEGEYEFVLVATRGDSVGSSVTGGLWLQPNKPSLRSIPSAGGGARTDASAPLYGVTDVDVAEVGGLRLGEPTSSDPTRPGVLLVEQGERIVLRIGSEANRRGIIRFDGGYFVLRVRRVGESGFAGNWASGTVEVQAEGHLCAFRLDSGEAENAEQREAGGEAAAATPRG